jgi:hypothetical protein
MTRRRTPIAVRLSAGLALAVGLVGCGLGDMPTRPPTASPTLPPTALPSPGPTVVLPPSPSATAQPSPTPLAYLVQPGDNLLSIARRYRTTGRSIAFWNRATYPSLDPDSPAYDPNRIEVGWHLVLIPGIVVDGAMQPLPAASPTPGPTVSVAPAAS